MPGGLRQATRGLCELDHISPYFFGARWWPKKPGGNRERAGGFWVGNGDGLGRSGSIGQSGNTMGQALQTWRSGSEQRAWLSLLIDTFEEVSRPEVRAVPCDSQSIAALRAQLAHPASVYGLRH